MWHDKRFLHKPFYFKASFFLLEITNWIRKSNVTFSKPEINWQKFLWHLFLQLRTSNLTNFSEFFCDSTISRIICRIYLWIYLWLVSRKKKEISNLISFFVSLFILMFSVNKKSILNLVEKRRKYLQF